MFFFLFNLLNPFLIAAAVLPAVFLIIFIYRSDRLERESPRLLIRLVVQGFFAAALAMISETAFSALLGSARWLSDTAYEVIFYFLVVGGSEEFCKYWMMKRKTWYSAEFNCLFDGVVYAICVSLGFALVENVLYVIQYGFSTALVRAVTAVPGHASFGVFMGAWYGEAKRCDNFGYPERSQLFRILSVLVPMLLHGVYDYIATRESSTYTWIFLVFIAAMFFISFRMVRRISANDQYID